MADPLTLGVLGGSALLGLGGSLIQSSEGRKNLDYQMEKYYHQEHLKLKGLP